MEDNTDLIKKIHQSKYKITYVSSGGGTNAISSFLKVPGASNTILESYVPYSKKSMDIFLNKKPDHYCSLNTCLLYTSPSPRDGLLSRMPSSA